MTASQSQDKPYDDLYGKALTPEQVAEMRFNLVNYVKTLIQMDKQHKAWLEQRKLANHHINKSGSKEPPEIIH